MTAELNFYLDELINTVKAQCRLSTSSIHDAKLYDMYDIKIHNIKAKIDKYMQRIENSI